MFCWTREDKLESVSKSYQAEINILKKECDRLRDLFEKSEELRRKNMPKKVFVIDLGPNHKVRVTGTSAEYTGFGFTVYDGPDVVCQYGYSVVQGYYVDGAVNGSK